MASLRCCKLTWLRDGGGDYVHDHLRRCFVAPRLDCPPEACSREKESTSAGMSGQSSWFEGAQRDPDVPMVRANSMPVSGVRRMFHCLLLAPLLCLIGCYSASRESLPGRYRVKFDWGESTLELRKPLLKKPLSKPAQKRGSMASGVSMMASMFPVLHASTSITQAWTISPLIVAAIRRIGGEQALSKLRSIRTTDIPTKNDHLAYTDQETGLDCGQWRDLTRSVSDGPRFPSRCGR
jgi:hypothetical protein